jgi:hypothetical protein
MRRALLKRALRWTALLATGLLLSGTARADAIIGYTAQAFAGAAYPLRVAMDPKLQSTLDPLRNSRIRLEGGRELAGGGYGLLIAGDGLRAGLAGQYFGIDRATMRYSGLPAGFSLRPQYGFCATVDLFLGYELGSGPVIAYVDIRGVFNVINVQMELRHVDHGVAESTGAAGWLLGVGPRVGVRALLHRRVFVDLSGYYGVVGIEHVTASLGLGVWLIGDERAKLPSSAPPASQSGFPRGDNRATVRP